MNFLIILATLTSVLAIAFLIFRFTSLKSYYNPSLIYGVYWLFNVVISLLLIDSSNTALIGNIYILFSILFFYFGTLTVTVDNVNIEYKDVEHNKFVNKKTVLFVIIIVIIGYFNFYSIIVKYNIKIISLFDLDYLSYINNKIAVDRYSGNHNKSIYESITLIFVYLSPLIGGYTYNRINKKRFKFLSFLTLTPAFLVLLLENTKVVLIYAVFLFLSSFLVDKLATNGYKSKIDFKKILFSIIVLLAILFFSMILRLGTVNSEGFHIIIEKFIDYSTGHMEAFNKWFSIRTKGNYTYGKYTFYSFFNTFKISIRDQGVYDFIEDGVSNVFTVFRGLISDYGVFGSLVFLFLFSKISNKAYIDVASKSVPKIKYRVLLTFVYFTIFASFLISSLTYMSITISFLFYFLSLYFLEYKLII